MLDRTIMSGIAWHQIILKQGFIAICYKTLNEKNNNLIQIIE